MGQSTFVSWHLPKRRVDLCSGSSQLHGGKFLVLACPRPFPFSAETQRNLPQRDQLCLTRWQDRCRANLGSSTWTPARTKRIHPGALRSLLRPSARSDPVWLHLLSSRRQRDGLQICAGRKRALVQVLHDNIPLAGTWGLEQGERIC